MKKPLLVALSLLTLLAAPFVVAFAGIAPLVDEEIPELGRVVKDGYVGLALLDAGDGSVVLVDAGNDRDGEALTAALAARGRTLGDVAAVFLTHGHRDHVAALPLLPNSRVYAMAAESPQLAGEAPYAGPLPRLFGAPSPVRVTDLVEDGATVRVGRLTLEGFLVPGHTPGSACWLVDGVLFVGDNATIETSGAVRPAPWVFSDDTAENATSLRALARRLAGREVRRVVPSHSGSLAGAFSFD
jgi:glyoxylase-like metal-dependent hydrolase (beta-lactamase superfamily II)